MKFFDLFAGIGGFHLGLRLECVGAAEIDRHASTVYARHFPDVKNWGDITKVDPADLPDFELLTAGFPCQAFSIAGRRKGFEDTRGTLFFEIARIAREKRPRLLLLENVKGLLSHDEGNTFSTILKTLDELGYDAVWQCVNSKYFVPQNRDRVFIVGHLRGTPAPQVFPYFDSSKDDNGVRQETQGKGNRVQIAHTICTNYHKGGSTRTMIYHHRDPFQQNRILDPRGISSCINTGSGGRIMPQILHKTQYRRLTPLECERLQGYPDFWTAVDGLSDTQRYRCIGNSVTVPVINWIGKRL